MALATSCLPSPEHGAAAGVPGGAAAGVLWAAGGAGPLQQVQKAYVTPLDSCRKVAVIQWSRGISSVGV